MIKTMGGFCKMKNQMANAEIEYLDTSDLSDTEYTKVRNRCSNAEECPYSAECPIFESAPKNMLG